MDTWMGTNYDPVTLHKYLYGNVDPVNNIDPTGNFSIGSLSAGFSTLGRLAGAANSAISEASILGASTDPNADASDVAKEVVLSLLPVKYLKVFSRGCKKRNSFDGDTLVATESGLKPIRDIKIGDKVWAYDEEKNEKRLQEVVHLIVSKDVKQLVDITLETGETITSTDEHPFYVDGKWLNAGDLKIGDQLLGINNDKVIITELKAYSTEKQVYNLTTNNDHNYFVGEKSVLVHNINLCNFAKGYANAQVKAVAKFSSLSNKQKKNRVVVGAFDVSRPGISTAGVSGQAPARVHAHLKNKLTKVFGSGSIAGQGTNSLCGHPLGVCAEFHAANTLLHKRAKYKNIFFTQPYRNGEGMEACPNCQSMGFDWRNTQKYLRRSAPLVFK